jgi:hypothetical protein
MWREEQTEEEEGPSYRGLPEKTLVVLAHRGDSAAVAELERRERVRATRDRQE